MASAVQHLLGQLVDSRFPLRRLLGVSANSAVFLTDLPNQRPSEPAPEAAIKLIPEDPDTADQQLERWRQTAALSHEGILRILHYGRCAVDGSPCLFVVTELANENLGDILTQRALNADETRGMMLPVLSTLAYLHENGLVHGGLKPSNILAIGDNIKLSPDRILPAGEPALAWPIAAPYAPPESLWFAASDVWSLGVTLYETLTQYLPNRDSSGRFVLPQVSAPFSEIIRGALVDDPTQRMTMDEIQSLLDPSFVPKPKPVAPALPRDVVTVEGQPEAVATPQTQAAPPEARIQRQKDSLPSVDPLSVPLSPVAPAAAAQAPARIPVSSLPNVNVTIAAPRRVAEPRPAGGSFKYFLIGAAATLLLAALFVPRLLRENTQTQPRPAASAAVAHDDEAARSSTPSPVEKSPEPSPTRRASTPPAPSLSTKIAPKANAAEKSAQPAPVPAPIASSGGDADAVSRVLPKVSAKARSTIRGTVRINVRVALNPDGTVASADLDSPAPSQFFAKLALDAARQWKFSPAAGSSQVVRFDFTNSATNAYVVH